MKAQTKTVKTIIITLSQEEASQLQEICQHVLRSHEIHDIKLNQVDENFLIALDAELDSDK